LFAKIEDIVTLSSEEVAVVREVGKAAIEVIRRRVMSAEDDEEDDETEEDEDDELQETAGEEKDGNGVEKQAEFHNHVDRTTNRPQLTRRNTSSDEEEDDQPALEAVQPRLQKITSSNASKSNPSELDNSNRVRPAITTNIPANTKSPTTRSAAAVTFTEADLQEADEQMDAVLDMVLTIVGEEFGQRDLLVARDVLW